MQKIPAFRDAADRTVLVTGGSGYVGAWMIVGLLARGFQVRATLRSLAKADALRTTIAAQVDADNRLALYAADLLSDVGWSEAVAGCDAVIHVASPMGQGAPRGTDLIGPARDGTLRVLRASAAAQVRRVVATSSTIAAQGSPDVLLPISDEHTWTDLDATAQSEYARSKTLAERAAWDFVGREGSGLELSTILPGMILGPVMANTAAGSVEVVARMLNGRMPAIPRIGFSVVDVRDLVDLHIRALLSTEAAGRRLIAAGDFLWLADIARLLRDHLGAAGAKVPRRALPDWVLNVAALFSAEARFMRPMLGRQGRFDISTPERALDWRPRPAGQTVLDCARSLIDRRLV